MKKQVYEYLCSSCGHRFENYGSYYSTIKCRCDNQAIILGPCSNQYAYHINLRKTDAALTRVLEECQPDTTKPQMSDLPDGV